MYFTMTHNELTPFFLLSSHQPPQAAPPPVSWVSVQHLKAPLRLQPVGPQINRTSRVQQVLQQQQQQQLQVLCRCRVVPNQQALPLLLGPQQLPGWHRWMAPYHQGKRSALQMAIHFHKPLKDNCRIAEMCLFLNIRSKTMNLLWLWPFHASLSFIFGWFLCVVTVGGSRGWTRMDGCTM